jgi:predicted N-acyltransferase
VDRIYSLRGEELTDRHLDQIWGFYLDTSSRKWGQAYLTREFFLEINKSLADLSIAFFAEKDSRIVACALSFQSGNHLYGRYWGCAKAFDCLHFELCYHQQIEMCIANGWTRFEAGAQGQHKLKRGLLPRETHSVHWLRHPGLATAVGNAMREEESLVRENISILGQHSPLRGKAQ